MKKLLLALVVCVSAFPIVAQQIEDYQTGVYTDIFRPIPSPVFTFLNIGGQNGTRGIAPLNTQYNLNYLQRGPFSLAETGTVLSITTMFKISQPSSTALGVDTLGIGFSQKPTATSFISPEQTGAISWWIQPQTTVLTGNGYAFSALIHIANWNGSTSAGFSWSTAFYPILVVNNWYKSRLKITRVDSSNLSVLGTIDDYGSSGTNLIGNVVYTDSGVTSGSPSYPFSSFTGDATLYPALRGMSSGGLSVVDNTVISGPLSPSSASSIQTVVELSFPTQVGKSYYIQSSFDLSQWHVYEGPISGTGGTLLRYYAANQKTQYFRIVPD